MTGEPGDDAVEDDETFNIRVRKVMSRQLGPFGNRYWREQPSHILDIKGVKTATIEDATPQQHGSYEDEKYGPNYSGTTFGE